MSLIMYTMRKVGNPNSILKTLFFSLALMVTMNVTAFAQDTPPAEATAAVSETGGDPVKGKTLFNSNCAACHKMDGPATGPALRGVTTRLDNEWLHKWIKNSSAMVKAGDAYSVKIFNEYNQSVMTAFPQLSDQDIDDILAYTATEKPAPPVAQAGGAGAGTSSDSGVSGTLILGGLILVLGVLVAMLFMVNNVLTKVAAANGIVVEKTSGTSIWKSFVRNQFLVLVTSILLLLAAGYYAFGFFMQVGVDQGYAPVQPIHYSHKIHAGDNGIDCKYCHSAARTSKTAGIPSLNVCMNCHKNISEVAETTATPEHSKAFYDAQIQKLYAAVGWDPATQQYTGKTQPVKWVRIHNLPDFAYFNHSQHVNVAGVECQTCHGPVETMEVMEQFAPLTMGWCVDCHRQTDVKIESNGYYEKIHAELSKKYGVTKLTAADMGGLECGKCHY